MANCRNQFQGPSKRVLCVCSAGLLRAPTAAEVLSNSPWYHNTRAVGLDCDFALIPIDDVLIEWADEIVCMDFRHKRALETLAPGKPILCLDIPDKFNFRNPRLSGLIRKRYAALLDGEPER